MNKSLLQSVAVTSAAGRADGADGGVGRGMLVLFRAEGALRLRRDEGTHVGWVEIGDDQMSQDAAGAFRLNFLKRQLRPNRFHMKIRVEFPHELVVAHGEEPFRLRPR